jgi:hypothetical protein
LNGTGSGVPAAAFPGAAVSKDTASKTHGPRSELGRRWAAYSEKLRQYASTYDPALKKEMEEETWTLFCLEVAGIADSKLKFVPAAYSGNKADFVHSVALSFLANASHDPEKLLVEHEKYEHLSFRTWLNTKLWWFMQDKLKRQPENKAPDADAPALYRVSLDEDELSDDDATGNEGEGEGEGQNLENRLLLRQLIQRAGLTQDSGDARILCLFAAGYSRKEAAAELGMDELLYKTRLESLKKRLKDAL